MKFEITDSLISVEVGDEKESIDGLFAEFRQVIGTLIGIYKLRFEAITGKPISEEEEAVINQRMEENIIYVPHNEIKIVLKEEQ